MTADGTDHFPLVMVGGVLEANKRWDIGKEVINCISKDFPGAVPIHPKVQISVSECFFFNFQIHCFYYNSSDKDFAYSYTSDVN